MASRGDIADITAKGSHQKCNSIYPYFHHKELCGDNCDYLDESNHCLKHHLLYEVSFEQNALFAKGNYPFSVDLGPGIS